MIEQRQSFHTLDGIRGIAATIVMTRHLPDMFGRLTFPRCYLAVDLFFVLSGFVIAHAYHARLGSGMGFGGFMRLRLIRFFPLYWLGFALGLLALVLDGGARWSAGEIGSAIVAGAVLLPAPFSPALAFYPLNLPCWSLGFELAINAVYAVLHRWLSLRVLAVIVGLSALGVVRYMLYFGGMNYGDGWDQIPAGAARVSYSFFAGVLVWHVRGARRVSSAGALALGAVVAGILLVRTGPMPFDIVMVLAGFPIIVWAAARIEPGPKIAPAFVHLGAASYGVYVLHTPLGHMAGRIVESAGYRMAIPGFGLGFIVVVTGLVLWLDRHFDRPLRARLSVWK